MEIFKAEENDLPDILELQRLAYRDNAKRYNDFGIAPLTQTLEGLREEAKSSVILKSVEEGKIIGSVRAFEKDGTCYIGRVIVHPDFQNRGIGKKLVTAIEENFKGTRYELFTGILDEKNLAFYAKLGYQRFRTERVSDRLSLVYLEKNA